MNAPGWISCTALMFSCHLCLSWPCVWQTFDLKTFYFFSSKNTNLVLCMQISYQLPLVLCFQVLQRLYSYKSNSEKYRISWRHQRRYRRESLYCMSWKTTWNFLQIITLLQRCLPCFAPSKEFLYSIASLITHIFIVSVFFFQIFFS